MMRIILTYQRINKKWEVKGFTSNHKGRNRISLLNLNSGPKALDGCAFNLLQTVEPFENYDIGKYQTIYTMNHHYKHPKEFFQKIAITTNLKLCLILSFWIC